MKYFVLLLIFATNCVTATSQDRIDINYVDTSYSALLKPLSVEGLSFDHDIYDHLPFGWKAYHVRAEVIESYHQPLELNSHITIIVYVSLLEKNAAARMHEDFLLSFCQSKSGIYYTSRDWLIRKGSKENIQKFKHVMNNGTQYQGPGDCSSSNDSSLNPDTHQ